MRWKEISEGKSSNELVNLLLQEVGTGETVGGGGAEFFDGQVINLYKTMWEHVKMHSYRPLLIPINSTITAYYR